MTRRAKRDVADEAGQTTAEYAFILGGVALIVAATVITLGATVQGLFETAINVF